MQTLQAEKVKSNDLIRKGKLAGNKTKQRSKQKYQSKNKQTNPKRAGLKGPETKGNNHQEKLVEEHKVTNKQAKKEGSAQI